MVVKKQTKKEITLIKCFAVIFKDEEGECIYTFPKKAKADKFFKVVKSQCKELNKQTGSINTGSDR
jgi:hypothetical protein